MKVIAIVGPTAVGKSELAVKIAKKYNGEIISCDSMQIYRGMNIGTAKPTEEETEGVPHHLIDIVPPTDAFSCADYAKLAKETISEIEKRGKIPVFCGGTGLYLDSVIKISSFCESEKDEEYRKELEELAKNQGNGAVYKMLCDVDAESASNVSPNNLKRVIRALEIYKCTGIKKSVLDEKSKKQTPPYDAKVFFLNFRDREKLYKKIDTRVDKMMENGLLKEVETLYGDGMLKEDTTAGCAIGYKEFIPYLKGEKELDLCIADLKQATRRYAKRQLTWFKRDKNYYQIYVDEENPFEKIDDVLTEEKWIER